MVVSKNGASGLTVLNHVVVDCVRSFVTVPTLYHNMEVMNAMEEEMKQIFVMLTYAKVK